MKPGVLLVVVLMAVLALPAHAAPPLGTILGRPVIDVQNETVGQLVDVLVDNAGAPVAAIVDVGGFLGVGARRVAVSWALLRFSAEGNDVRVHVDLRLEDVAAGAEFRGAEGAEILTRRANR